MRYFIIAFVILNSAFCIGQKAEFSVDKGTFTFPKTKEGPVITHDFVITNTGTDELVISDYKVSCPCTKVILPAPILPGDTGIIQVNFETKGKYYEQDRSIILITNTKKGTEKVRFKVFVIPEED
ncbi:DUF1573 domain-containing protein [Fluviicola taffensis]|uniref:DUF1573 domain-containing protein n=1 Tax=Fluviicola taffensis (strain DSM 16823 / NCIMB 13979 / RW262) TaxID=755732 RepID=F2IK60_FLUTR|nr:DUF1573 domain-containing protein [Fluviicola taffensis]AEA42959.1 protein of unknown function DUF1573 [Fluviicola taffensis DSM 16823]